MLSIYDHYSLDSYSIRAVINTWLVFYYEPDKENQNNREHRACCALCMLHTQIDSEFTLCIWLIILWGSRGREQCHTLESLCDLTPLHPHTHTHTLLILTTQCQAGRQWEPSSHRLHTLWNDFNPQPCSLRATLCYWTTKLVDTLVVNLLSVIGHFKCVFIILECLGYN